MVCLLSFYIGKKPKNKERASHSKYPYKCSRKGYARLEQKRVSQYINKYKIYNLIILISK